MNLNGKQIIAIIIAVLGVLMISQTQLTDLFGAGVAKTIVSVAALANSVLGAVMAVLTSQGSQVKDVLAMPGVERVEVNAMANKTLAAIAVQPNQAKIAPAAGAAPAVNAIAKGT